MAGRCVCVCVELVNLKVKDLLGRSKEGVAKLSGVLRVKPSGNGWRPTMPILGDIPRISRERIDKTIETSLVEMFLVPSVKALSRKAKVFLDSRMEPGTSFDNMLRNFVECVGSLLPFFGEALAGFPQLNLIGLQHIFMAINGILDPSPSVDSAVLESVSAVEAAGRGNGDTVVHVAAALLLGCEYFRGKLSELKQAAGSEVELGEQFHQCIQAMRDNPEKAFDKSVESVAVFATNFRKGACEGLLVLLLKEVESRLQSIQTGLTEIMDDGDALPQATLVAVERLMPLIRDHSPKLVSKLVKCKTCLQDSVKVAASNARATKVELTLQSIMGQLVETPPRLEARLLWSFQEDMAALGGITTDNMSRLSKKVAEAPSALLKAGYRSAHSQTLLATSRLSACKALLVSSVIRRWRTDTMSSGSRCRCTGPCSPWGIGRCWRPMRRRSMCIP